MGMGNNSSAQSSILDYYTAPIPDIAKRYEQNLYKGGFLDMPSFKEMFESYRTLGEREAGRQTAAAIEAFGSQGGRYSSDLLGASGRIRENLFDQLLNKAGEYQLGLRQQQGKEVSALANLRYGASEAGMARYFQDFLRRTSPPPLYGDIAGMSGAYGVGPVVV